MTEQTEHISIRTYVNVFIALLVLLVATVGVTAFDLGVLNLPVALLIAGVKTTLVLMYFMHLKPASGLVRLFALAALVWLGFLIVLALSDYVTRGWVL